MHTQDEVFDSFLFFLDAALLPSMGIASLKTTTYPGTLTPAPVHSHSNSPPQAPLKLRPNAPQTITPFSLPVLQAGLGMCTPLPVSLWIAAPVQGTGYQFPQVREQVRPVGRTGHQSRVKEQVSPVTGTGD